MRILTRMVAIGILLVALSTWCGCEGEPTLAPGSGTPVEERVVNLQYMGVVSRILPTAGATVPEGIRLGMVAKVELTYMPEDGETISEQETNASYDFTSGSDSYLEFVIGSHSWRVPVAEMLVRNDDSWRDELTVYAWASSGFVRGNFWMHDDMPPLDMLEEAALPIRSSDIDMSSARWVEGEVGESPDNGSNWWWIGITIEQP